MTIPKITIGDLCAAGKTSKFNVFCVFSFPLLLWKVEKRLLQKSLSCPEIPLCLRESIPTYSGQAVVFFCLPKKKQPKFMFCCLNVCSWNHWWQDQALSCFSLKQLVVACMWCCREIVEIVLSGVSTAQIHCLVTISEESAVLTRL